MRPVFDDPNLVSSAGLLPALKLADSAGLSGLLGKLTVPSANAGSKAVYHQAEQRWISDAEVAEVPF